jgi:hypothetical protein
MPRHRIKSCGICAQTVPVLYRIQHEHKGDWVFVCPECCQRVSQDNQFYVYGGTWKANRK